MFYCLHWVHRSRHRAAAVKRSQHASGSLSLTILLWRPYDLSAERLCASLLLGRMPQLPQTTRGYRYDNGGATLQPWMRSRRYCDKALNWGRRGTNEIQILSQDLEQADPTVYQIIERVRHLPLNPERHTEPDQTRATGEKPTEALH
jgi:hypothetical protein